MAAAEDYTELSMHWDLPVGGKLVYFHDFPGMYNAISQVIFFHNPMYAKRMQNRDGCEALSKGEEEAVHIVPCMCQVYPDIKIAYESDMFPALAQDGKNAEKEWNWVVMGRTVYLLAPDGQIFYHPNVIYLLTLYLGMQKGTRV